MRFIDPDGREPGDKFKTKREAAKDWGKYYNGASIVRGKEMSSTIYKTGSGRSTVYSYTEAIEGKKSKTKSRGSGAPDGTKKAAIIHSHGNYDKDYKNNEFSNSDKQNSYNQEVNSYVATPNGTLQEYDPYTTEVKVVSTDLPSDPKDPDRKNDIKPVDIPKQKTDEEAKKKHLQYIEVIMENNIKTYIMKKSIFITCCSYILLLMIGCNSKNTDSSITTVNAPKETFINDSLLSSKDYIEYQGIIPEDGFVPTAEVAAQLGYIVLAQIYGIDNINQQLPFSVNKEGDTWVLEGHLEEGMDGGVAYIEIDKQSGQIKKVVHTK